MFEAALAGFGTGISLIAAIGAQNAFVLRQGLRREHVGAVVAVCAVSDGVLILLGVLGMDSLLTVWPAAIAVMRWVGIAFLVVYGAMRFRAAATGGAALAPSVHERAPLSSVLTTSLLLTWGNPHVYLDTVVLVGSLSAAYGSGAAAFGLGAAAASVVFFSALAYGARLLAPLFARPRAWIWLDVLVGATMWAIALRLTLTAG